MMGWPLPGHRVNPWTGSHDHQAEFISDDLPLVKPRALLDRGRSLGSRWFWSSWYLLGSPWPVGIWDSDATGPNSLRSSDFRTCSLLWRIEGVIHIIFYNQAAMLIQQNEMSYQLGTWMYMVLSTGYIIISCWYTPLMGYNQHWYNGQSINVITNPDQQWF